MTLTYNLSLDSFTMPSINIEGHLIAKLSSKRTQTHIHVYSWPLHYTTNSAQ